MVELICTTLSISTLEYSERKTNSFSFSQSDGLPSVNINKGLPDGGKKIRKILLKLPQFRAKIYELMRDKWLFFFREIALTKKNIYFFREIHKIWYLHNFYSMSFFLRSDFLPIIV